MEKHLASAISAIRDRLPGLNLYQHIYNEKHELDTRIQAQIVLAYQGFIEFCMDASTYYKSGGPRKHFSHEPVSQQYLRRPCNMSHPREVAEGTGKAEQHSWQGKQGASCDNGYTANVR